MISTLGALERQVRDLEISKLVSQDVESGAQAESPFSFQKGTGKKLHHLLAGVPTGMLGISLNIAQRFAFWLAGIVSELFFDRDTLTCR